MSDGKINQALAQGNGTELCEFRLGPAFSMKPASETVITTTLPIEKIRHLYSEKPLRFNQVRKLE